LFVLFSHIGTFIKTCFQTLLMACHYLPAKSGLVENWQNWYVVLRCLQVESQCIFMFIYYVRYVIEAVSLSTS